MADYTREVVKQLKANGCTFKRHGKGDHDIWHSPINDATFVVDGSIKSKNLANVIMKQAGIDHNF